MLLDPLADPCIFVWSKIPPGASLLHSLTCGAVSASPSTSGASSSFYLQHWGWWPARTGLLRWTPARPPRNPSRRPAAHGGGGGAARVRVLREDGVAAGVMRRRPARPTARGLQGSRRQQCSGPRPRAPAACRARGDGGGGAEDAEEEVDKVIGRAAGEDPCRGMERGRQW